MIEAEKIIGIIIGFCLGIILILLISALSLACKIDSFLDKNIELSKLKIEFLRGIKK